MVQEFILRRVVRSCGKLAQWDALATGSTGFRPTYKIYTMSVYIVATAKGVILCYTKSVSLVDPKCNQSWRSLCSSFLAQPRVCFEENWQNLNPVNTKPKDFTCSIQHFGCKALMKLHLEFQWVHRTDSSNISGLCAFFVALFLFPGPRREALQVIEFDQHLWESRSPRCIGDFAD